jgi:type II secretory pathway component PulF
MSKESNVDISILDKDINFNYVNLVQKMLFAKHLSLMLKSGLTITDGLSLLYGTSRGGFKKIIGEIYTAVKSGETLSSSMSNHPRVFSSFLIGSIYAGEASGNLENNLENIALQLRKEKDLLDKIKNALFYPVLVLMSALAMGFFIAFFILPKITPVLTGLRMELPWATRALITLSMFGQAYFWQIIIVTILGLIMILWTSRQSWAKPIYHGLYLKLPVVGRLVKNVNLARFSMTLGILLKSGLTITEALNLTTASTGNYYYHQALSQAKVGVDQGSKLSDQLAKHGHYFPEISVRMIRIGEESGKLEETMLYLADFYDSEVDNETKNLATLVEPMLLIGVGLVVLFLILSIITPIYSITRGVTR